MGRKVFGNGEEATLKLKGKVGTWRRQGSPGENPAGRLTSGGCLLRGGKNGVLGARKKRRTSKGRGKKVTGRKRKASLRFRIVYVQERSTYPEKVTAAGSVLVGTFEKYVLNRLTARNVTEQR